MPHLPLSRYGDGLRGKIEYQGDIEQNNGRCADAYPVSSPLLRASKSIQGCFVYNPPREQ